MTGVASDLFCLTDTTSNFHRSGAGTCARSARTGRKLSKGQSGARFLILYFKGASARGASGDFWVYANMPNGSKSPFSNGFVSLSPSQPEIIVA